MGLWEWLGWRRAAERVREGSGAEDDRGWRRASPMGGSGLNPDRDELHGEALLQEAFRAYTTNPLAYAIIEQTTSFVLGGGARVVAKDARVQRAIDAFWNDPENEMALRVYSLHTELSLFGEQFVRFFVDGLTGRVVIRQLDPLYVTEIETDPEDMERAVRYCYRPPSRGMAATLETTQWIAAGEVLHVAVNKVSSSLRGRSDLAPVLPYIRRYREWLDDRILQNRLKSAVVWDVTVAGADQGEINRMRAQNAAPPARGTVLFHNEGEVWKPVHADVDAGDAAPDGRAIRLMVAVGALLPEHYLAEGGHVNRATAAEMGLPAIKRFQRRQQVFRAMLGKMIERVLEEATRVGRLGPRMDRTFAVQFEELTTAPLEQVAAAVERLSGALRVAAESGWVTEEEARRLWWRYAGQVDESAPQEGGE